MIRDSSDEEDDDEEEEEEPIDFAAEVAKTATRSLAKSATASYLKALLTKCEEAVGDPVKQAKQLQALDDLVARHPEMANKRQPVASPVVATPAPEIATPAAPAAPTAPAAAVSQTASPASAQTVSPASPASPVSPTSPEKKPVRTRQVVPETPKEAPKKTPQVKKAPAAKSSTASSASRAARSRPRKEARPKPRDEGDNAGDATHAAEALPDASTTGPLVKKKDKAASTSHFETTMRPSPKALSASSSLTQLPSGTWRGPVETSGNEREMFLRSLSKHESMPLLTFRPRRGKDLWVTNLSNPAPGTYPDLDESRTSKYLAPRQVSFGFSRKGSRWPGNADQKPGPGAHSLVNFERFKYADPVRHSFGGAPRGRPNPIRQTGPGPGAYGIQRSADEEGPAVTMVGKYRKRGVLNYDDPGPGAYDPSMVLCGRTSPSIGFATALREDFYPKEDKGIPAPGTYEVMKQNPVGSDGLAFSMAGKRKRHDLTAHLYAGPGPGFYNHGSTFGYGSTWQVPVAAPPPLPWAPPM